MKEINDSIHIRFTAYVAAAIRNKRIKYLAQRDKHNWLEIEQIDLQERLYVNFDEQVHSYLCEPSAFLMDDWEYIEEFMEHVEDRRLVRALNYLKERDRKILFARLFGEQSFIELGTMFDMTPKQVERAYYYVLRKLRRKMEAESDEF